jgi:hypothetical protein
VGLSLVAFDTNSIKQYVFETDKLKEIRGASSLLDYLNRFKMDQIARRYHATEVYANGGSGLYYVATEHAGNFGREVQQAYHDETGGRASITFAQLPLRDVTEEDIETQDITDPLETLQWHLQGEKLHPPALLTLASHPFLRLCDACGVEYADASIASEEISHSPSEEDERYCTSCQRKRKQEDRVDRRVRQLIQSLSSTSSTRNKLLHDEYMWTTIIERLHDLGYDIPKKTERPNDFDTFRNFKGAKDYFGLIYADGNNMGRAVRECKTLPAYKALANDINDALYTAVCTAIVRHLKIDDHLKPKEQRTGDLENDVFPFDILLLGGDDICMLVPASVALDVALTMAETFRDEVKRKQHQLTLSVGVVLAPIKYPFGLLQETASTALKFAKKASADARADAKKVGTGTEAAPTETGSDDTRINYLIVTGGSSSDFKAVYEATYHKEDKDDKQDFYATLRPYAPNDLRTLLNAIRSKDGTNLGRTKLHQIREAVLKMNLTTSVSDGLAVLVSWREKQRNHVVNNVYEFAGQHQLQRSNPADPVSGFPRVVFPWFSDGKNKKDYPIYRTSLLDFIELYDFVSREGGDIDEKG